MTEQQALSVLMLGKGIKVKNDMTPTQLNLLHDTRGKLKNRIEICDENITIKNVRGTPTSIGEKAKN